LNDANQILFRSCDESGCKVPIIASITPQCPLHISTSVLEKLKANEEAESSEIEAVAATTSKYSLSNEENNNKKLKSEREEEMESDSETDNEDESSDSSTSSSNSSEESEDYDINEKLVKEIPKNKETSENECDLSAGSSNLSNTSTTESSTTLQTVNEPDCQTTVEETQITKNTQVEEGAVSCLSQNQMETD
jgi:hypothetical protein